MHPTTTAAAAVSVAAAAAAAAAVAAPNNREYLRAHLSFEVTTVQHRRPERTKNTHSLAAPLPIVGVRLPAKLSMAEERLSAQGHVGTANTEGKQAGTREWRQLSLGAQNYANPLPPSFYTPTSNRLVREE